jgi:hypothetical protein
LRERKEKRDKRREREEGERGLEVVSALIACPKSFFYHTEGCCIKSRYREGEGEEREIDKEREEKQRKRGGGIGDDGLCSLFLPHKRMLY